MAGQKATKEHPSAVPEHSSGLPAQMQDTRTTESHLQGFRLKHSFLAPHSTVWFPGAHEGLMVTILWSLKFLGNQLWPSPFTTGEGLVKATVADAVLSRKGHYVTGWQCSNPIKHRQSSYQFISAGSTSPRAAAEQTVNRALGLALSFCNSDFLGVVCLAHFWQLFPGRSLTFWEPGGMGAWWEQTLFSQWPGKGSSFRTCCCNQRLWLLPAQVKKHQALSQITRSAPRTSLCPDQLYYHMHKNIYCFTSYFSVKVNRNWLGVASQILTVEPEAQHKYRGASECKCLLWILESSSAWAAGSVCVREALRQVCTHIWPPPQGHASMHRISALMGSPLIPPGTQMLIAMRTDNICIKAINLE